jgi:hypothetical protein
MPAKQSIETEVATLSQQLALAAQPTVLPVYGLIDMDQPNSHGAHALAAVALNGPIEDAAIFNATFPDPGSVPGLPDLAEPGEVIRGKPVYGLTGDWDASRPGDNNVFAQLDSGMAQDVSDGIITYGFFDHLY